MPGKVYILGAGASLEDTKNEKNPMPLAKDFFKPNYIKEYWPKDLPPFRKSALAKVLNHFFGISTNKKELDINIEQVYSFIATYRSNFQGIHRYQNAEIIEKARLEMFQYIYDVIRYIPWHLEEPNLHSYIINNLNSNDSLITFNWDLICDRVLSKNEIGQEFLKVQSDLLNPLKTYNLNVGYEDLAIRNLHRGYFLKLHGSINLAICTNNNCYHNSMPLRFGTTEESLESWSCPACGSPIEILIMPPYMHKTFTANRFLQLQASIAVKKLSIADEIIIIGYSMPIYDFNVQTLLRIARLGFGEDADTFLEKITIVNPQVKDQKYVEDIKDIFGLYNSKRAYGHPIEFEVFASAKEYMGIGDG